MCHFKSGHGPIKTLVIKWIGLYCGLRSHQKNDGSLLLLLIKNFTARGCVERATVSKQASLIFRNTLLEPV